MGLASVRLNLIFALMIIGLFGSSLAPIGCGRRGLSDRPVPQSGANPASTDSALALSTEVPLDTMETLKPYLPTCLEPMTVSSIKTIEEAKIGGRNWLDLLNMKQDPSGDSRSPVDIVTYHLGQTKEDLLLVFPAAVARQKAASQPFLTMTLGGVGKLEEQMEQRSVRKLRWRQDAEIHRLEDFYRGSWRELTEGEARSDFVDGHLVIHLAKRHLGDPLNWPSWWLQLDAASEASVTSGDYDDSTGAQYFSSLLSTGDRSPVIGGCQRWANSPEGLAMEHVTEATDDAPEGDRRLGTRLTNRRFLEGRNIQLARLAVNSVQALVGQRKLPLATFTLLEASSIKEELPFWLRPPSPWTQSDLYRGLSVQIERTGAYTNHPFANGQTFAKVATQVAYLHLELVQPTAPVWLQELMARTLRNTLERRTFGRSYWLDLYTYRTRTLFEGPLLDGTRLPGSKTAGTKPIAEYAGQGFNGVAEAKLEGLAAILSSEVEGAHWWTAWFAATAATGSSLRFADVVQALPAASVDESARIKLMQLGPGWLIDNAYEDGRSLELLGDRDEDGLPNFLEGLGWQTDAAVFDSDGDGWSDLAEWTLAAQATPSTFAPKKIMPDGSFADWLNLLPKRVAIDEGVTGPCPVAADITHYSALANEEALIVAAHSKDIGDQDGHAARWELAVDIPTEDRQLLLSAGGRSREVIVQDAKDDLVLKKVYRAMPMGKQTVEWVLRRSELGINSRFDEKDVMRLRFRTVYRDGDQDIFCDETPWFQPFVSNGI